MVKFIDFRNFIFVLWLLLKVTKFLIEVDLSNQLDLLKDAFVVLGMQMDEGNLSIDPVSLRYCYKVRYKLLKLLLQQAQHLKDNQ